MKRVATFIVALVSSALAAAEFQVLTAREYHLRSGTNAEWESFAAIKPYGRRLDLEFTARSNAAPHTLLIAQDEVKQDWRVELNGRRIGSLFLMESPLVMPLSIPAGALRNGANVLSIIPPGQNDDIRIGPVKIASGSPAEVLSESTATVQVLDADSNQPLPCRITILDNDGRLAALSAPTNQPVAARPGVVYTANGRALIHLLAGRYTFHATRGFEYGLDSKTVTLRAGSATEVRLRIRREVATPGLVSCDTHTHTFTYSRHGDATVDERAITLAGEGIELPIATDHDILVDLAPVAERTGTRNYFTPVVGDEVTTRVGHFNIFPVTLGSRIPTNSLTNWTALLDSFRATPGVQVVVFNHPRNIHTGFQPFARTNFNSITAEARWPFDFRVDAMELLNSSAQQSEFMSVYRDWFALLNRGHRITAVGSSDVHDVSRYIIGQGRTYIACRDSDASRIDVNEACRSLREGRASVCMGLLPIIRVNERSSAGDLVTATGKTIHVEVDVLAPSWIRAEYIELFANGIKIREQRIQARDAKGVKARVSWRIPRPLHDAHLIAIAAGPGVEAPYWPISKPYQPVSPRWTSRAIGSTNPVWVDADGDGRFSSAREYALAVIKQAAGNPEKVFAALRSHDEAVAIQAAGALVETGVNIDSTEWMRALANAGADTQRGFEKVVRERLESKRE